MTGERSSHGPSKAGEPKMRDNIVILLMLDAFAMFFFGEQKCEKRVTYKPRCELRQKLQLLDNLDDLKKACPDKNVANSTVNEDAKHPRIRTRGLRTASARRGSGPPSQSFERT